jgi:hypothetical protein
VPLGLRFNLQSFGLAPVASPGIVFCSRDLKGLESGFATLRFLGFGMIGRRGLADPEVWEEVESGSGEDGGRTGRCCGDGGSMMVVRREYQVGWC